MGGRNLHRPMGSADADPGLGSEVKLDVVQDGRKMTTVWTAVRASTVLGGARWRVHAGIGQVRTRLVGASRDKS